jgi:phage terminase small subunit
MARNGTLSHRQLQFLHALLTSRSVDEAARRCRLSTRQAFRYLNDAQVQAELRRVQQQLLEHLVAQLTRLCGTATAVLEEALVSGDSWSARIRAADVVLSHVSRLLELASFEARLAELERRVNERREP